MKLIGLIGGMSWQSSAEYYKLINEMVSARLGGFHSARLLMHSVDFGPIERAQAEGRWDDAGVILADAAISLERGGVEFLVLATNTMHKVADAITDATSLTLIHIVDATGEKIKEVNLRCVGLLGTRFTMEDDFYRARLRDRFGLDVLTPDSAGRDDVHRIIYEELCHGRIEDSSRRRYVEVIDELTARGAEGVILGCTEIPLLVRPSDVSIPVFETTRIHAEAAVERALV